MMKLFKYLLAGLLFCSVSGWAKVNINTASADELKTLRGVGAAKAEQIVAYRNAHGPFASPEDLLRVKGIGAKILEKNRHDIEVSGQAAEGQGKVRDDKVKEKTPEKTNKKDKARKKESSSDNAGENKKEK